MFILTKGKVFNTDEAPALVLFTQNELAQFRAEPANVDIKCSFPPEWGNARGEAWMNENKGKLIVERDKAARRAGNVVETTVVQPPPSAPSIPVPLSDKDIRTLLGGMDADTIEFEDKENEHDG